MAGESHWFLDAVLPRPAILRIKRPVRFSHDFETFSKVDLTKVGSSRYSRHPSTEALMLAYAFDYGPVSQWVPAEGERMPDEVEDALLDERILKVAWNAPFERSIWMNTLGYHDLPPEQWRDTMVLAYSLSFPGKLERAGEIVELPEDLKKQARGKLLMRKFSMPRKPSKNNPLTRLNHITNPKEWEEYKEYNVGDVVAEVNFWKRTWKYDLPPHEWGLWALDQKINEAGVPVNMKVVNNVIRIAGELTSAYMDQMKQITGLPNPNSNDQILPWLQAQGYIFDDLKKGHVERAFKGLVDSGQADCPLAKVLYLRMRTSKSSIKKYNALADATDDDGYLRHTTQFAGAGRTWRWAGRRFQTQNLARPAPGMDKHSFQIEAIRWLENMRSAEELLLLYENPIDVLSTCIRPVIQAPPGYTFVIRDLNAIENRVLGWMASCVKILNVFAQKRDPYIDFATYMYGEPYDKLWEEYKAGNKEKRTIAKPGVLGCGYMLGPGDEYENKKTGEIEATGLLGYAWNMHIRDFTKENSELSVRVWRQTFEEVVDFWWRIEKAARRCIVKGTPQECWPVRFDRVGPFMRMHLPSGRCLHYCRPRIEPRKTPWGEVRDTITYEGLDDKGYWTRIQTHPGKLTENADQAISRDLLANGMRIAFEEYNLLTRLHAHDELVCLVEEDKAEQAMKGLEEAMERSPTWGPDLPLGSEGFISRYYVKG